MIDKVATTGLVGVQRALQRAVENAEKISQAFSPKGGGVEDFVDGAIGLEQSAHDVKANLHMIKKAEELGDSLLSILA